MNDIYYLSSIKKMLIFYFTQYYINVLPPDEFIFILNKIFENKKIVIDRLAKYVKLQVEEKNRPIDKVLDNLSMFAVTLKEYAERNLNL